MEPCPTPWELVGTNHLLAGGPSPAPKLTSDILTSSPLLQRQADYHLAAISDSENETHGFQWLPVTSLSLMVLLVGFALSVVQERESTDLSKHVQTPVWS